jgi:hypothetical protein
MHGPIVIVPPALEPELKSALDSDLDVRKALFKIVQPWYTLPDPTWEDKPHNPYRMPLRRILEKSSGAGVGETAKCMADLIDERLGDREDWKEFSLWYTLRRVFAVNVSRLYVGPELSHNDGFLTTWLELMDKLVVTAFVINMFPEFIKP